MKKVVLVLFFFTFFVSNGSGQNRSPEEIKSMMIYNFLKYIQWPTDDTSTNFTIGVIGDDKIYTALSKWYGNKQRGGKKFAIVKYKSINDISQCHLLYIGESASRNFGTIKEKLQNKSTLTISSKNGMGKAGSCINFRIINNRLKFELNRSAVQNAKLKVANQLSSIAIPI